MTAEDKWFWTIFGVFCVSMLALGLSIGLWMGAS